MRVRKRLKTVRVGLTGRFCAVLARRGRWIGFRGSAIAFRGGWIRFGDTQIACRDSQIRFRDPWIASGDSQISPRDSRTRLRDHGTRFRGCRIGFRGGRAGLGQSRAARGRGSLMRGLRPRAAQPYRGRGCSVYAESGERRAESGGFTLCLNGKSTYGMTGETVKPFLGKLAESRILDVEGREILSQQERRFVRFQHMKTTSQPDARRAVPSPPSGERARVRGQARPMTQHTFKQP